MSDEVTRLRKKIKTIDPLKQKNEIELNVVRQDLKESLDEYDESLNKHTRLLGKQKDLVDYIHNTYGNDNNISIHDMNNARHYLHKLEDDVMRAKKELSEKTSKVDSLKQVVTGHQLSRKLYDKAQSASETRLGNEMEKIRMNDLDEMCSRKLTLE